MSTNRNFYDILNASSTASVDELKSNYKQLILQCHPDKLLQQQQQQQTIEVDLNKLENNDPNNMKFVAITEAWQCLKDPSKRKQYDAELLLNKFHTHNNIYAHIKLNELKKQLNTEDYDDDDDDVDEVVNEAAEGEAETLNEHRIKEVCGTTKYIYTYDCRCGGQYIVDESAEQYCRTGNRGSDVKNNDNNVHFNGVEDGDDDQDDDDDADSNITQNNNSPNNTNKCKNDGGVVTTSTADGGSCGSEGIVFNEDNEEGGELIVECSECSLVIILNG